MAKTKRKSWLKRVVIVLAAAIVLLGLLVVFLPSIIAGPGRGFVVSTINDSLAGSVQIDGLSLSWGGPQQITGLTLSDPDGGKVMSVASVNADLSLLSAAFGSRDFGTITIDTIDGSIVQDPDGSTNLQRAVAPRESSPDEPDDPSDAGADKPLRCRVEISNSRLTYQAPGIETVTASKLAGHVQVDGLAQIAAAIEADVAQGAAAGTIDAKLTAADLFDAAGAIQLDRAKITAESDINDLPIDVVDRLANMNGRLTALLGPKLDQRLNATYEAGRGSASIVADSENLTQATVDIAFTDTSITIGEGSKLTLRVTPQSWRALTAAQGATAPATLLEPFELRVVIPKLNLPRHAMADSVAEVNVTISDIVLQAADERIGRVALRGTSLGLATQRLGDEVAIALDTKAEQGAHRGEAHVKATLRELVDDQLAFTTDRMQADVVGDVTQLPLAVFDELLQQSGLLVAALGERLDASINAQLEPGGQAGAIAVSATSTHLQASVTGQVGASSIELAKGSHITLALQPAVVARFTQAATLLAPAKIEVAIERLTLPRGESADYMDAAVDAAIACGDMRVQLAGDGAPLALGAPNVRLQSTKLRDAVSIVFSSAVNGGAMQANANLQRPAFADGRLSLGGGSTLVFGAQPAALAAFMPDDMRLASDLQANITINNIDLPTDNLAAGRIALAGTVQQLAITGNPSLEGLSLHGIAFSAGGDAALGTTLPVGLDAKLRRGSDEGQVQVRAQLAGVPDASALSSANVRLIGFPTAIADALGKQEGKLVTLLGERMDVKLDATPRDGGAMDFDAEIRASQLQANATGRYSPQQLRVTQGATVKLTLTPQSFAALQPTSPWRLMQPATVSLTLNQLVAALPQDGAAMDLRQTSVSGTLSSDALGLQREGETLAYRLRDITASIDGERLASSLGVNMSATLVYPPGADGQSTTGQITSKTTVGNLADANGALDMNGMKFVTDTSIDRMPSDLVLTLAGQDPRLGEALGPSIAATFIGSYPGDMKVNVTGRNTSVAINGRISDDRVLTLYEPAVMHLNVTPRLAELYLSKLNPLFAEAQSGEKPVILTLAKDGFALPLSGGALSAIAMNGRLEIGTLLMKRGRFAGQLTSILRALGSSIPNREQFEARFTPLVFTVKDGVVRSNDLWIDTDAMLLGAQARIYLPRDAGQEANAEVLFAVPGETVRLIPGTQRVDPAAIYTTATAGPLSQISPDFKQMLTGVVAKAAADAAGSSEASIAIGIVGGLMRQRQQSQVQGGDNRMQGWSGATWPNRPVRQQPVAQPPQSPTPTQQQPQQQQPQQPQPQQPQEQQQQQGGGQSVIDSLF